MDKTTELIPYIAGYIDGDGCLYIGTYTQKPKMIVVYERSIQIASVKKEVLSIFKKEFGGSIIKTPFKKRHRDSFCWSVKGAKSTYLAEKILPFLVDKKAQCSLFIQYSQLIKGNSFKTVESKLLKRRNNIIYMLRKDKHKENMITKECIDNLKDISKTVTPSDIDYPYFAGLIDSEGCFRIKKWKPKKRPHYVYNITLEIGNTKLPLMPWLVERFGGSVVFIPAKKNKRSSATWTLSAAALYEILPKIRPFLTNKQSVCDKLIEFQKTILPNGGDRHSELFRALFEKRREIRERIIDEVHLLNRKGSH